jgi:hypothetical protein
VVINLERDLAHATTQAEKLRLEIDQLAAIGAASPEALDRFRHELQLWEQLAEEYSAHLRWRAIEAEAETAAQTAATELDEPLLFGGAH